MPEITEQIEVPVGTTDAPLDRLPFPPLTAQHILNCSYHAWQPRTATKNDRRKKNKQQQRKLIDRAVPRYSYRTVTPKARIVPLSAAFLAYLRADGIVLPPDTDEPRQGDYSSDDDSGIFSATENPDAANDSDDDEDADPSAEWRDVHEAVKTTIAELGGKVVPKLNWSAPKDATWINATNSMECRSANDVYLLLKSSDFVTHDLEHALDDCEEADVATKAQEVPYYLVLRKYVQLNPSLEFRCFVRNRRLLALCQRDLNHFDFLFQDNMSARLRSRIQSFFDEKMRDSFPDPNFAFDVYVPPPHEKVWLIDVNPWAQRTDPLLWSWLELLTMDGPDRWEQKSEKPEQTVRILLRPSGSEADAAAVGDASSAANSAAQEGDDSGSDTETPSDSEDDEVDAELWAPELRLVRKDDPEAYGFATPQYSAHKLPRDVVDASRGGEGSLREFAEQWKEILAKRQKEDEEASDSD